jgi:hypothetical protein
VFWNGLPVAAPAAHYLHVDGFRLGAPGSWLDPVDPGTGGYDSGIQPLGQYRVTVRTLGCGESSGTVGSRLADVVFGQTTPGDVDITDAGLVTGSITVDGIPTAATLVFADGLPGTAQLRGNGHRRGRRAARHAVVRGRRRTDGVRVDAHARRRRVYRR